MTWIAERSRTMALADRDLPCLGDASERLRFSEELRRTLLHGLDADLVQQYLSETGSNCKPRPSFSLPWSAMPEGLPAGTDFSVRLRSSLVVNPDADGGAVEVRCGSRTCRFPRGMQWILDPLNGGALSMGRLIEAVDGRFDEAMVRLLVEMLMKQNLVAIIF